MSIIDFFVCKHIKVVMYMLCHICFSHRVGFDDCHWAFMVGKEIDFSRRFSSLLRKSKERK